MPSSPSCLLRGPSLLLWAGEELITWMLVTCGPSPSRQAEAGVFIPRARGGICSSRGMRSLRAGWD